MQRGETGHRGPERVGTDELNAARVRLLITDALAQLSAEHREVIRLLVLPRVDDGADRRQPPHYGMVREVEAALRPASATGHTRTAVFPLCSQRRRPATAARIACYGMRGGSEKCWTSLPRRQRHSGEMTSDASAGWKSADAASPCLTGNERSLIGLRRKSSGGRVDPRRGGTWRHSTACGSADDPDSMVGPVRGNQRGAETSSSYRLRLGRHTMIIESWCSTGL